ncbi:MAG: transglycosylase family protein [Acidimicrobiales bacterium]
MRKHRLFGVVIAVLLAVGVITQRPSSSHPAAGIGFGHAGFQLVSDTAPARTTTTQAFHLVQAQAFLIRPSTASAGDTLIALSALMTPLPPIPPPPPPPPRPAARPPVTAASAGASSGAPPGSSSGDVWMELRQCESNGNYADDTGNGYYGAYQFSAATWQSLGLSGVPSDSPPDVQDQAAHELQARSGWGQWPSCSRRLGLT